MEADSGQPIQCLNVDGGMTANSLLMQFQADVSGVQVCRPRVSETTALGAAYAAGLAVGYWKRCALRFCSFRHMSHQCVYSIDELQRQRAIEKTWHPVSATVSSSC